MILFIDDKVQSLMNCVAVGRFGLQAIHLNAKRGVLSATDGNILAQMKFIWDGPDLMFSINRPGGRKALRLKQKELLRIDLNEILEGEPGNLYGMKVPVTALVREGSGYVEQEGRDYEIEFFDPKSFPKARNIVTSALDADTGAVVGIDLNLLKKLLYILGPKARMKFPTKELEPIVVSNASGSTAIEIPVDADGTLGIIMPMRVD